MKATAATAEPREQDAVSGVDPRLDAEFATAWSDVQGAIDHGDRDALSRAVHCLDAIVREPRFAEADLGFRLAVINRRGVAHRIRVHEYGGRDDVEIALDCFRFVLESASPDWPHLHRYHFNHGLALSNLYDQTSELSHLDASVEELDGALAAIGPAHESRSLYLHGLGLTLWRRYKHTGVLADLERSIDCLEEASGPDGQASSASYQLSVVVAERYDRTHDRADLDRAVELAEAAVRALPDSPPRLTGLGNRLITLARMSQSGDDADRAVEACRRAVDLTPADSADLASRQNNLGNAHSQRYDLKGDIRDLRAAATSYESAIALTTDDAFELPSRLYNLGNTLSALAVETGPQELADRTVDVYRSALQLGLDRALEWALGTSRAWAAWSGRRSAWDEVAEASLGGVEAVRRLFRYQLARGHKETWLREASGLAQSAALALTLVGVDRQAAVTLERGRAMLFSEVLERDRANLEGLRRDGQHELAERYEEAARRLDRVGLDRSPKDVASSQKQFEAAVAAVRAVPGHEDFLQEPTFADITAAGEAAGAPIVYLGSSGPAGFAVLIADEPSRTATSTVLSDLDETSVRERVTAFNGARAARYADPQQWLAELDSTTRWLWDAALGQVLELIAPRPRAVVIPTGLLASLPLHAAWTPDESAVCGRRYALDEALLTYAPNARGLLEAHQLAADAADDRLLAVEEPAPVAAPSLPGARVEIDQAARWFATSTRLRRTRARKSAVERALARGAVLHFCCHGRADLANPLESSLLLARNERLTIRDLLELRLANPRLAVLSACDTAVSGTALPDEVVAMPTALLQAGVAGVIGSLWAVPDRSTTVLLARFYELWRDERLEPAEALRQAQRWTRDSTNGEQRDRYSAAFETLTVPRPALQLWLGARASQHPYHWAAHTYLGT